MSRKYSVKTHGTEGLMLVKAWAPNRRALVVDDLARLRSGGPAMRVKSIRKRDDQDGRPMNVCTCVYDDSCSVDFVEAVLELLEN